MLRKRTVRTTDPALLRQYPALRGFHNPQRDRVTRPMPKRGDA